MFKKYKPINSIKDSQQYTCLHYACQYGYLSIVKSLLSNEHFQHYKSDTNPNSPYNLSERNHQTHIIAYFDKNKSKTHIKTPKMTRYSTTNNMMHIPKKDDN